MSTLLAILEWLPDRMFDVYETIVSYIFSWIEFIGVNAVVFFIIIKSANAIIGDVTSAVSDTIPSAAPATPPAAPAAPASSPAAPAGAAGASGASAGAAMPPPI
jgi:predicted lipid-binding transport protein (Tim44 family)